MKKFLEVDAAWRILSDQDSRRQYDLERRGTASYFISESCTDLFIEVNNELSYIILSIDY